MKKGCLVSLIVAGVAVAFAAIVAGSVIGLYNQEATLATAIHSKQQANTAEFDNMWKKIKQVAEIPDKEMDNLKEIFMANSQARTSDGQGQMMAWIHEAVPTIDTTSYKNLMNIVTSSRDAWTMRQVELVDLNREHNKLLAKFPSGAILRMMGKAPIDIQLVTSTKTSASFDTGVDDNVELFDK